MKIPTSPLLLAALLLAALFASGCGDEAATGLITITCPEGFADVDGRCAQLEPIAITPSVLSAASVGRPYVQTLEASGGARPYSFTTPGPLPSGLSLSSGGQLSGTPTAVGEYGFTVTATDSLGASAAQPYLLRVLDDANNPVNACAPTAEQCDGLDNDCDGQADEGVLNTCGACGALPEELCDGLDNNCDGILDEGCPCEPGQTEACGGDVGVCAPGERSCEDGAWGACVGAVTPAAEQCGDGLDNDCDGMTDEGCAVCVPSAEVCDGQDNDCDGLTDEGDAGSPLVEACSPEGCASAGERACADGQWGACALPAEVCNDGLDNNCDGDIDEGCPVCVPAPEVCDGLDNDCDGQTDEDDSGEPLREVCSPEGCATSSARVCAGGQWGACPLPAEVCDGVDNDCDGAIDDGAEGVGLPCGEGPRLCEQGQTACVGGAITCQGAVFGDEEVCNGEDDDCDGQTDEEVPEVGESCTSAACALGAFACQGGALTCDADDPAPSPPGTVATIPVEQGLIRAYTGTTATYVTDQGSSSSILITSDGARIYNVALGINGAPFTGWTVRVFQPTARQLQHVETFTIPADWEDEGAGRQGIVGVAADGDAIWVTNFNSFQTAGDGVWRLDLNARTAEFVHTWGTRFTSEGPAEYDWARDVFWTIQLNESDPVVFRYPGTGIDPGAEEARFQVNLPDNSAALGTIASNGVDLFAMPYTNEPRTVASALWRFGSGLGGSTGGSSPAVFAMLPAAASITYHRDGAIYVPDQDDPTRVRRVTVTPTGDEVCDGLDNNCNGQIDEGACGGVDLDITEASGFQITSSGPDLFIQYTRFNRGDAEAPATTDQVVLRRTDDPNPTQLASVNQPAQPAQAQRASQLTVRIPADVPTGTLELAVIADAPATTGDTRRANNTRTFRVAYTSPFTCSPDRFEEDDTFDQSTPLDRLGFEGELRLCGSDDDWYQITVPARASQSVFIGFSHAQGDLDAYLYTNSPQPVLSAASDNDNEFLRWENNSNSPRVYYLQLTQSANSPRIDYTVSTGSF